ncbi:hypothetical protein BC940DRAFT_288870 [Gongronella butleri]|nr:hypothetical protein BC940DRAFT_288870 [Gongronella butleri]
MPLYLPSNKPRSLHRQAPSHVHGNSTSLPSNVELSLEQWLQRDDCQLDPYPSASSLPGKPLLAYNKSTSSTTSTNSCSSANSHDDPLSPVSLPVQGHDDDNIDVPALSPPPRHGHLPCPCCKTTHCDTWDRSVTLIRKLEGEIRLAAEIGQNLLQKNETYALEVGQMKDQLHLAYERRHHIEASLDESENMAQRLNREKDKWLWQYEKSEKVSKHHRFI